MHRPLLAALLAAGLAGVAHADPQTAQVQVTRSRLPSPIILDVSITGGARRIAGSEQETASGLALGVKAGRRLGARFGVVAVLEADAMARDDYFSYGTWTAAAGLRWQGPVVLTVG